MRYGLLLCALTLLHGCSAVSGPLREGAVNSLLSAAQCGHLETTAEDRWIDNRYEWDALTQVLRQQGATRPAPDAVNFDLQRVLVLYQGRRPTPGYGQRLAQVEAYGAQGARLQVEIQQPDVGALLPQVITSPCLILAVDRELRELRIEDGRNPRTLRAPR